MQIRPLSVVFQCNIIRLAHPRSKEMQLEYMYMLLLLNIIVLILSYQFPDMEFYVKCPQSAYGRSKKSKQVTTIRIDKYLLKWFHMSFPLWFLYK